MSGIGLRKMRFDIPCAWCGRLIPTHTRAVRALGRHWHPDCWAAYTTHREQAHQ